jgi:hypothetical protein
MYAADLQPGSKSHASLILYDRYSLYLMVSSYLWKARSKEYETWHWSRDGIVFVVLFLACIL